MFLPERRFTYGIAWAALLPGLAVLVLVRVPELGPASLDNPFLWAMLPKERERADRIDRGLGAVRHSSEAKQAAVLDLVHGRTTLLEAAARMRDLDRAAPGFKWEQFRQAFPGVSDEERHCREIIARIPWASPLNGPTGAAVARRCEEELRDHIAHGTLHLPDAREQP